MKVRASIFNRDSTQMLQKLKMIIRDAVGFSCGKLYSIVNHSMQSQRNGKVTKLERFLKDKLTFFIYFLVLLEVQVDGYTNLYNVLSVEGEKYFQTCSTRHSFQENNCNENVVM